jgi:hypothetical protein
VSGTIGYVGECRPLLPTWSRDSIWFNNSSRIRGLHGRHWSVHQMSNHFSRDSTDFVDEDDSERIIAPETHHTPRIVPVSDVKFQVLRRE